MTKSRNKMHFNFEPRSEKTRCGKRKDSCNFTTMINLVTCETCKRLGALNVV